jgi:hypothetical protein
MEAGTNRPESSNLPNIADPISQLRMPSAR